MESVLSKVRSLGDASRASDFWSSDSKHRSWEKSLVEFRRNSLSCSLDFKDFLGMFDALLDMDAERCRRLFVVVCNPHIARSSSVRGDSLPPEEMSSRSSNGFSTIRTLVPPAGWTV